MKAVRNARLMAIGLFAGLAITSGCGSKTSAVSHQLTAFEDRAEIPSEDQAAPQDAELNKYFPTSYAASRSWFRTASQTLVAQYSGAQSDHLLVPSRIDPDLTIDYLHIPAQKEPAGLVIITSGVHGAEGYTGSAFQKLVIEEMLKEHPPENLGYLLIHAVNPFGFKYFRRTTENNVDLNRNFSRDGKIFAIQNEGYTKLNGLLNPEGPVSFSSPQSWMLLPRILWVMLTNEKGFVTQATAGGQYQFSSGIFFGGKGPETNGQLIGTMLREVARPYTAAYIMDVHTGYGEKGRLHHWQMNDISPENAQLVEKVFAGLPITSGSQKDFYRTTGDFTLYVAQILAPRAVIPMTFEYGTLDSHTTLGGFQSLKTMRYENQGFHFGYKNVETAAEVRRLYKKMFYPGEREWREGVLKQARETLKITLPRFRDSASR